MGKGVEGKSRSGPRGTRCAPGAAGKRGEGAAGRQPFASAFTRERSPLKRLWSPTTGPVEVYCHIV
ncbi:hypothetical protein GCM10010497_02150 [Streptomyces cinereoruber]|uniref:Uncharacterized protein n=1 Tax=Streptomyces cinereoruber TaxID=67260 RepID=A0AAV4K939_9ACTN|nr:hypothetical protein GCM10010497_02150 [Streptomyces cinereoruber]